MGGGQEYPSAGSRRSSHPFHAQKLSPNITLGQNTGKMHILINNADHAKAVLIHRLKHLFQDGALIRHRARIHRQHHIGDFKTLVTLGGHCLLPI